MKAWILFLLAVFVPAHAGTIYTEVPESPEPEKIYLIYLHGRIIENSGPRPTDSRYGLYDYPAILEALSSRGAVVISAQRPSKTDVNKYAGVVVSQVEELIDRGVPPGNIVVAGFSKGGGIATRVSSFLRRPEVRFVLLAACPAGPPCSTNPADGAGSFGIRGKRYAGWELQASRGAARTATIVQGDQDLHRKVARCVLLAAPGMGRPGTGLGAWAGPLTIHPSPSRFAAGLDSGAGNLRITSTVSS